ncbi:MAG: PQQ-binding-like beta-propeller repeat protein [Gemmatimonadales bacterium]
MSRGWLNPAGSALGAFALVVMPSTPLGAQVAWHTTTAGSIIFQLATAESLFVVSTDSALLGLDATSGTIRWQRPDLPNRPTLEDLAAGGQVMGGRSQIASAAIARLSLQLLDRPLGLLTRDSADLHAWLEVLDLGTGETRWTTRALPLRDTRGALQLPGRELLLVYGVASDRPGTVMTLLGVGLQDGEARWRRDLPGPKRAAEFGMPSDGFEVKRGTIALNQPPLVDSDTTAVLFIAESGPERIDLRTGQPLWHAALEAREPPAPIRGYAQMLLADGWIYIPHGRQLQAISVADGHPRWAVPVKLPARAGQLALTPHGLLVRGEHNRDRSERASDSPDLRLIDPETGADRWISQRLHQPSPFLLTGETVWLATDSRLLQFDLTDGKVRDVAPLTFGGEDWPTTLERRGLMLFIGSRQSLRLVTWEGISQYEATYPAPSSSFLSKLAGLALLGFRSVNNPELGFWHRYHATGLLDDVVLLVSNSEQDGRSGPGLLVVDKATGKPVQQILVNQKSVVYQPEPVTGMVSVQFSDHELRGYPLIRP